MIKLSPLVVVLALGLALLPQISLADSNADVVRVLSTNDVYVSPAEKGTTHFKTGDQARLQRAVQRAGKTNVPVKIAIVSHYPRQRSNTPQAAADKLRTFIDFSGVLVLVSPRGMGVSSDLLSSSDVSAVTRRASPQCSASYSDCAVTAVNASIPRVKAEEAQANHNVLVFWLVFLVIFGALIVGLIWFTRRRQQQILASWHDEPVATTTE